MTDNASYPTLAHHWIVLKHVIEDYENKTKDGNSRARHMLMSKTSKIKNKKEAKKMKLKNK